MPAHENLSTHASDRPSSVPETLQSTSLFAHEAAALDSIDRQVQSHKLGLILANLELHDPQSNRYFEVDLIVVAPFGIYVVELKHWSGLIEIRPNSWLQNASFFKADPHKANNFKAKLLRGFYERKFPQFPSIFFESVVVLTNPDVSAPEASIPTTTANNPTFDSIDRFLQYLKHRRKTMSSRLTDLQCHAFADYVKKFHTTGKPRDFVFPGYEVVERLYQHEDRAEVVARRTDIRHRRLSRLRIFYPVTDKLETDKRRAHERATATLNAVSKVGDHPNILKVWAIPNENNYLVEGSDWSETGTLEDVLEREGVLSAERATAIAVGLTYGLHALHQQCVVHRALSPENVLMVDDTPKLMNFDLSFQIEDDRVTVIPDATKLKRTPYIAPEIYSGGDIPDGAADLFSVGVILYEMLAGRRPFGCSTDLERSNGTLTDAHRQELAKRNVPAHLVELVFSLVQQEPSARLSDTLLVLKRLQCVQEPSVVIQKVNPQLAPGDRWGLYAIEQFLRLGAESQIYRAVGVNGRKIALKLFDRDVPQQRVVNEHRFSGAVLHPNIVRLDSYGQWSDDRYFIAFCWISEEDMRARINARARPDVVPFYQVASQLLSALEALHRNIEDGVSSPILHNDIKPDNILFDVGDRPVLVDFGAASAPHVGTYEGTEGYVAPDSRLGQDRKYSEDGDLYALAVSLHEWLIGDRPGGLVSAPPDVPIGLVEWLRNGSSLDESCRFATTKQMREALEAAMVPPEAPAPTIAPSEIVDSAEHTVDMDDQGATESPTPEPPPLEQLLEGISDPNPFVPYLNSLHRRNAETDNALAESQARNPFFSFIHVSHPLVTEIESILLSPNKRHVIVTGHAGDGKSTIAVELVKRLTGRPVDQALTEALKRREDIVVRGTALSLVKDFSEWSSAERVELLKEMLAHDGRRFFLISNTGTMLDTFKVHEKSSGGDWLRIENDLLEAMSTPRLGDIAFHETTFSVFNIAMMDNLGIAQQIFERMLASERWQPCSSAECRHHCPIFRNVRLIQANQAVVTQRLFLAYRRMYEYGTRLTLRQLCAHMAYTITSGLTYTDVVKMSQRADPPPMAEFMFFNRFFGDNGKDVDRPALQIRAIREVREQGFGAQPCPTWERKLWLKSRGQTFQLRAKQAPDDLEFLQQIGAGMQSDDSLTGAQAREQVRRAVFFLHSFDEGSDGSFRKAFLKSLMLLDFVRWQSPESERLGLQETTSLHRRIMHVLQEHFSGVKLLEGIVSDRHLTVTLCRRSHDVRQSAQVVLARYPEDDFQVRLITDESNAGGVRRDLVFDGHRRSKELVLRLTLPFLDYVMMRNQGEVGRDLQASYIDRLERFKGQLIRSSASKDDDDIMLVRLRTNNTFRRQIYSVRGNRLEVTDG